MFVRKYFQCLKILFCVINQVFTGNDKSFNNSNPTQENCQV